MIRYLGTKLESDDCKLKFDWFDFINQRFENVRFFELNIFQNNFSTRPFIDKMKPVKF